MFRKEGLHAFAGGKTCIQQMNGCRLKSQFEKCFDDIYFLRAIPFSVAICKMIAAELRAPRNLDVGKFLLQCRVLADQICTCF